MRTLYQIKERARNNGIQQTQGNRNPFIDYPDLAEYLWGEHSGETLELDAINSAYCLSGGSDPEDPGSTENPETPDPEDPEPETPEAVAPDFGFANASVTITYGEDITNTLNTNTDGAITYSSSAPAVAAIEGGVVVVKGVGTTTITASAAATANYLAAEASYTLTVEKANVTITFAYPSRSVNVGGTTTNKATASPVGTVTYSSSNTTVATVNSTTGVVTGVAAGTATITARVAETANYNAAEKSYTVTVEAAAATEHSVRWVVNGVTLRAYTEEVQDGQKPSVMPGRPGNIDCEHLAWVFLGWSADGGAHLYQTLDEIPAVTGDVTYYAVFGENN